jgi:cation transport ATPase
LVEQVKGLGFKNAKYAPESDKADIRVILQEEVNKYRNRFFLCLLIQLPIWVFIWILAYTNPMFVIEPIIGEVLPLFLLIIIILSSIIQFYLGLPFYMGAYKSIKHGSANMDVLVVLGTTAAWFYGFLLLFIGNPFVTLKNGGTLMGEHANMDMSRNLEGAMGLEEELTHITHGIAHNFEVSSTLITVILLGKLLETFSKKQTVDKLS